MKLPMPKEKEKLTDKRGLTLQWKEFTLSVTESSCIPLLTELMKGLVEEC